VHWLKSRMSLGMTRAIMRAEAILSITSHSAQADQNNLRKSQRHKLLGTQGLHGINAGSAPCRQPCRQNCDRYKDKQSAEGDTQLQG
jgi:hypothetical protein